MIAKQNWLRTVLSTIDKIPSLDSAWKQKLLWEYSGIYDPLALSNWYRLFYPYNTLQYFFFVFVFSLYVYFKKYHDEITDWTNWKKNTWRIYEKIARQNCIFNVKRRLVWRQWCTGHRYDQPCGRSVRGQLSHNKLMII